MGYALETEVKGFKLQVGNILRGLGILLNIQDEKIYTAIKKRDPQLLDALNNVIDDVIEYDIVYEFDQIDSWIYQGHQPQYALKHYTPQGLEELQEKALHTLKSEIATQKAKDNASDFLTELQKFYEYQQLSEFKPRRKDT